MLQNLRIQNFAIIEDMDIDLQSGLNVLLGETGAGKSIIVEALSLLKGTKSAFSKIRDESKNAVIEGTFVLQPEFVGNHPELSEFLEGGSELIVSRVLTPAKTSKARVNGISVTLSELKTLMERVVDIHSQGENYALFDESTHRRFLDLFDQDGMTKAAYLMYRKAYEAVRSSEEELGRLIRSVNGEDREYLEYQLAEIDKYGLKPDEIEDLEHELEEMSGYDDLKENYAEFLSLYQSEENSFETELIALKAALRRLEASPLAAEVGAVLERACDFEDAISDLMTAYERLDFDPLRLENVNRRIYELSDLRHKYGSKTATILEAREKLAGRLDDIDSFELDRERLEKSVQVSRIIAIKAAENLTAARSRAAQLLEQAIGAELEALGLLSGGFRVEINPTALGPEGADEVRFLLALNRGSRFLPLCEAASGGENSRLMLALKTLFNRLSPYATIVFDEIDVGISGSVAAKVGVKIREVANDSQTLVITHLPQVAAQGEHHYLVAKKEAGEATVSEIVPIAGEAVVYEIARMMSGDTVTPGALEAARGLIGK